MRFYFSMTDADFENMTESEFATRYRQLNYALDFDSARANSDGSKQIFLPF